MLYTFQIKIQKNKTKQKNLLQVAVLIQKSCITQKKVPKPKENDSIT